MSEPTVILADIGGTNTRVALATGTKVLAETIQRFANADFPGLAPILRRYLDAAGISAAEGVCIAAAGPVTDGVAEMTNLDWVIDRAQLEEATGARRVAILNDLQAQGHALGRIAARDLQVLMPGPEKSAASMLVVGMGTGMNAAPVHLQPGGRVVAASECGHTSLPVRTAEDFRLAEYLAHRIPGAHGFAGVEEAIAGRGLANLFSFCAEEAGAPASKTPAEVMDALKAGDPIARHAGRLYTHVAGHVLGNLALTHLPLGGIFLIGGVARAMSPWFDDFGLASAFADKGRFSEFMASFRITQVLDDYAALTGCAAFLDGIHD